MWLKRFFLTSEISDMFFKQKSTIKHMHTICRVCLLEVLCPRQYNNSHIEPVDEPTHTVPGQA